MKRFFVSILVSLIMVFGATNWVQVSPSIAATTTVPAVEKGVDAIEQLKTTILPQIQNILTPEQEQQLETAIVGDKISIRKAFKSLMLTPDQKTKLAAVFKSLPKKEIFTSMTPAQKRQFFMTKKEIFLPTPEEIAKSKSKPDK
jgi:Spy/CpxP family protein refolding chaperone